MNKSSRIAILLGLAMALLLAALDQTVVATALPRIVADLGGLSQLSWVFTAYMLAATVTVPIHGKLSDTFGQRNFFLAGIGVFLLGSALSGISQTMTQLIIFRGLQGVGAGSIMVNTLAVIGHVFSPKERARWQGMIGGVIAIASVIGPLVGGWLSDQFTWRWIFYVNIPLGLAVLAMLARSIPKTAHDTNGRSIDFAGAFLIALCLVPLLLAFVWGGSEYAWGSDQVVGLFALAGVSLIAFALVERKTRDPIISFDLFKNRVFSISLMATFLSSMGMFGAILYLPLFAQGVIGVSATSSGLILMPMMLSMAVTSIVAGQIVAKTGSYRMLAMIGLAIAVTGMFLFSRVGVDTTSQGLAWRMVLLGIGIGPTMPIFILAMQNAFPRNRVGEVTASAQLFRGLGGTVGAAILAGVMNTRLARNLSGIQDAPFLGFMRQIDPDPALSQVDINTMQQFLTPEGQERISAMIAQSPPAMHEQLAGSFNQLLGAIKTAFSNSIDQVYLVGAVIVLAALVAVFFLPRVTLRKDEHAVLQETGLKLEEELGQSDKLHQPEHQ
ncbi:MAG: MFS transporter [Chloroflexi bacterium]|nr:MFS transporter [Chloroflexota bacterium]